jgi:hypothetical protein
VGQKKLTMIVEIRPQPADDKKFLTAVNGLLARLVSEFAPERVCAIRLNMWFDHKWLTSKRHSLCKEKSQGRALLPAAHPSPLGTPDE